MRVAFVAYVPVPSRIADSVHAMKMCQALVRRGHKSVLYALPGRGAEGDAFEMYGCGRSFRLETMARLGMRGISGWHYGWQVVRDAERSFKPDLYYVRHVYTLALASRSSASLVYEAHEPPSNGVQRHILGMVFRMKKFRRLVVISRALQQEYMAIFPGLAGSEGKVIVAHDGADRAAEQCARTLPNLRGRPDAFAVGYVGALYTGKGMEVIGAIAARLPEMDFHVVGGEDIEISDWRKRIRAPNVIFYGYRPHSEAAGLMAKFDAVLLPLQGRVCSLPGGRGDIGRWTSPNKLFEYMAQGKAIVASKLPVLEEVIEPERNALTAAVENPSEWVCALRRLTSDSNLRRKLSHNARADFEREYSWDKRAERVLEGIEHGDSCKRREVEARRPDVSSLSGAAQ